jgi:hypothetical protein
VLSEGRAVVSGSRPPGGRLLTSVISSLGLNTTLVSVPSSAAGADADAGGSIVDLLPIRGLASEVALRSVGRMAGAGQ